MKNFRSLFFGVVIGSFLVSCSQKTIGSQDKLPKVKPNTLFFALDSLSQTRPSSFYAKLSTKYKDSSRSQSFKTTVRSQSDSLLKASISVMRIPFVHALFSNEIVQVSNRNDKCYIRESVENFTSNFGINISLKNLEEILLGLPLNYQNEQKYYVDKDPFNYRISTHSKIQMASLIKKKKREILLQYTLSEDLKRLKQITVNSFHDSTEVIIDYSGKKEVDGFNFPEEVAVKILSPKGIISLNWSYSKVRINGEENFHFVIPETYTPCAKQQ